MFRADVALATGLDACEAVAIVPVPSNSRRVFDDRLREFMNSEANVAVHGDDPELAYPLATLETVPSLDTLRILFESKPGVVPKNRFPRSSTATS